MMWRDYVVYSLLIAIVAGALLYMVWALVRPAKGQWNEHDRELGQYRARHWAYKERVPSLKAHLMPESPDTHYWPGLANTIGHEALSSRTGSDDVRWRAALAEELGERPRLYFSVRYSQLHDARELELPEVLLRAEGDSELWPGWAVVARNADKASLVLNEPVRTVIASVEGLTDIHMVGDRVTFVLNGEVSAQNRISLIEDLVHHARELEKALDRSLWV